MNINQALGKTGSTMTIFFLLLLVTTCGLKYLGIETDRIGTLFWTVIFFITSFFWTKCLKEAVRTR